MNDRGGFYTEYDYYINQFIDCPHAINRIDLSKEGWLPEQDKYENSWFSDGIRFDNIYEFWDGEVERQHQHPKNGDIYYEYRSHLCNKNLDMYKSKYMCWGDSLTYRYCNQDLCGLCHYLRDAKFHNKDYLLHQKFVQPIE